MANRKVWKKHELNDSGRTRVLADLKQNIGNLPNLDGNTNQSRELLGRLEQTLNPITIKHLMALIAALKGVDDFNFHNLKDYSRLYVLRDPESLNNAVLDLKDLLLPQEKSTPREVNDSQLESLIKRIDEGLACDLSYRYHDELILKGIVPAGMFVLSAVVIASAVVSATVFFIPTIFVLLIAGFGLFSAASGSMASYDLYQRAKKYKNWRISDMLVIHKDSTYTTEVTCQHPLATMTKAANDFTQHFKNLKLISMLQQPTCTPAKEDEDAANRLKGIKTNRVGKLSWLKADLERINECLEKVSQQNNPEEHQFLCKIKETIEARIRVMETDAYLAEKLSSHRPGKSHDYSQQNSTLTPGKAKGFRPTPQAKNQSPSLVIPYTLGSSCHALLFIRSKKLNRSLLRSQEFEAFIQKGGRYPDYKEEQKEYLSPKPVPKPQPRSRRSYSDSSSESYDVGLGIIGAASLISGL